VTALPSERDAILIVDPNAISTRAITPQPLEAIAGGNQQILEACCHVQQFQLPLCARAREEFVGPNWYFAPETDPPKYGREMTGSTRLITYYLSTV
jgi:hypothetical protein